VRRAAKLLLLAGAVYTLAAVEDSLDASPVGELELKGFGRAIPAYEVHGLRSRAG
jgi:hypothetical protein